MATTVIMGDVAEGSKWWGTAEFLKTQLAAVHRSNNAYMHTWKQVSSETRIFCEMRAGTPWAFIFTGSEMYMESGFYDFISTATCNINTYKPAILHYNSPIQGYIGSLEKPLQGKLNISGLTGEQLLDGVQSRSVGGAELATTAFDICGNTYTSETEIFATDSDKIRMQKMAQNRVPSSVYSGKMRLFIQAVYGSKRSDYRITLGVNNLPMAGDYNLYMDDKQGKSFDLRWEYPYTCGIYTTDDHQFYLMKVVTNEIHFYPLSPSSSGSLLRTKLLEAESTLTEQDIEKLEAYILSTCQIDTENAFTIPISGALSIAGGPLGYGWKFSRSGKKCTIVIHEDISPLGDMKEFQAHELTVTITQEDASFTASMTETDTGTWSFNPYFVAWVPEFYTYSQYQFGTFDTSVVQARNAPLYGWYEGETYKTLRVELGVDNVYGVYDTGRVPIGEICAGFQPTDRVSGNNNGANGEIGLAGIFDKSVEIITANTRAIEHHYWSGWTSWSNPVTHDDSGGVFDCDYGGLSEQYLESIGQWYYASGYYHPNWIDAGSVDTVTTFRFRTRLDVYDTYSLILPAQSGHFGVVIPLLDSESVVMVDNVSFGCYDRRSWLGGRLANYAKETQIEYVTVTQDKTYPYAINITGSGGIHSGGVVNSGTGTGSIGTFQGVESNVSESSISMKIAVKSSGNFIDIEDGYDINISSSADYLWGVFGTPLGGKTIISKSSYNGANVTYHGEEDGENRNGYRNHSAVGWA